MDMPLFHYFSSGLAYRYALALGIHSEKKLTIFLLMNWSIVVDFGGQSTLLIVTFLPSLDSLCQLHQTVFLFPTHHQSK